MSRLDTGWMLTRSCVPACRLCCAGPLWLLIPARVGRKDAPQAGWLAVEICLVPGVSSAGLPVHPRVLLFVRQVSAFSALQQTWVFLNERR